MGLIKLLWGTTSAALGGWTGYAAIAVVAGILASSASGWVVHRIDTAKYEELQVKDAKAATQVAEQTTKAVTEVKDKEIAIVADQRDQAIAEASQQQVIITKFRTIEKEIPVDKPVYITKTTTRFCVPAGLVWMFNAAVTAANSEGTADLGQPPTGESYDDCSQVPLDTFTATLVTNFEIGAQNAQQLNALEAAIITEVNHINEKPPEVSP